MDIEAVRQRFGFVLKTHRMGSLEIKAAQVECVDDMVREVYPQAVSEHGDAPVWMISWPAAFALAEYLLQNYAREAVRVLELGCGTAVPGIALEKSGARVVCTDYDSLALEMARHNASLNGCSRLETRFLDWYRPELSGRFELVVGSEIVYFEKSFPALLSVLKQTLSPGGRIVLSDQVRPQMALFLERCCREGFSYRQEMQVVHLPEQSQKIRITVLSPPVG